jgi:ABC-type transporter Mla subunit MlaD
MQHRKVSLIDRLRDRGFVDQWGFVFFAGVGSVAIVAGKHFALSATVVALGAIGLMIAYSILIARSGSGRLRSDQAGDNCYYLGLIYTLSSLAYAIFFFDPADAATTIVQGFGIALATTVAGLVLRVFFNQGRPDLENVEEMARLELTEAAGALKTELSQVVRTMNDFSRQVRQAMGETRDAATSDINTFTTTAIGGLQQVIDTARESLQTEASDFAARTKQHSAAVDQVMKALERHGDNLDRLNEAHETMTGSFASIHSSATASLDATAALAATSSNTSDSIQTLRDNSEAVAQMVGNLSSVIDQMNVTVGELSREIAVHIGELRSGPSAAVAASSLALQEAGMKLGEELAAIVKVHGTAATAISKQASDALETTRSHNHSLAEELSQSRDLLHKVQANLTEMTAELVTKVREQG